MKHPQKDDSWSYSYYNCDVKIINTVESSLWMSVVHNMFLIISQKGFGFCSSDQHTVHNSTAKYNRTWLINGTAFTHFFLKKHFTITYSKLYNRYIKDSAIYTLLIVKDWAVDEFFSQCLENVNKSFMYTNWNHTFPI